VDTDFARSRIQAYVKRPAEELFDLRVDPWCLNNLASKPDATTAQVRLSKRMDVWMKQQGDSGDATERSANERQPKLKPWSKKGGGYSIERR